MAAAFRVGEELVAQDALVDLDALLLGLLQLRLGVDLRLRRHETGHRCCGVVCQPLDAHEFASAVGQPVVERARMASKEGVSRLARCLLVGRAAPIGGKGGDVGGVVAACDGRRDGRVHDAAPEREENSLRAISQKFLRYRQRHLRGRIRCVRAAGLLRMGRHRQARRVGSPSDGGANVVCPNADMAERARLNEEREARAPRKKWGPSLSATQWGTVREDYGEDGSALFGRVDTRTLPEVERGSVRARGVREQVGGKPASRS